MTFYLFVHAWRAHCFMPCARHWGSSVKMPWALMVRSLGSTANAHIPVRALIELDCSRGATGICPVTLINQLRLHHAAVTSDSKRPKQSMWFSSFWNQRRRCRPSVGLAGLNGRGKMEMAESWNGFCPKARYATPTPTSLTKAGHVTKVAINGAGSIIFPWGEASGEGQ